MNWETLKARDTDGVSAVFLVLTGANVKQLPCLLPSQLEQASDKCRRKHLIHICGDVERPPQGLVLEHVKVLKPSSVYIAFLSGSVFSEELGVKFILEHQNVTQHHGKTAFQRLNSECFSETKSLCGTHHRLFVGMTCLVMGFLKREHLCPTR